MNDIVERLRTEGAGLPAAYIKNAAADEIERLRAQLFETQQALLREGMERDAALVQVERTAKLHEALEAVERAARNLPRATPAPGGAERAMLKRRLSRLEEKEREAIALKYRSVSRHDGRPR